MHKADVDAEVELEDPVVVPDDCPAWVPPEVVPLECVLAELCAGAGGAMLGAGFGGLLRPLACKPLATLLRNDSAIGMCDAIEAILSVKR